MSSADRRAREKQAVRDTLLQTAWELFSSLPADEVTMRVLADRAEYSPRTLYLYFEDREALLSAVAERAFAQTLGAAGPGPLDPAAVIDAHMAQALEAPRLYETIFFHLWRPGAVPGPNQKELEARIAALVTARGGDPARAAWAPLVLRTLTMGLIRQGSPSVADRVTARTLLLEALGLDP